MDELLKTILESEVLTDEVKAGFKTQFETFVKETEERITNETRAKVEAEVRTELAEQYVADKAKLIEALDSKAEEFLKKESEELHEDINSFRDLEAEFAERLVEARAEMAESLRNDLERLVETTDAFLEHRLNEEITQLKESIEEVRKEQWGRELYEAYSSTFHKKHGNASKLAASLTEAQTELEKTKKELLESKKNLEVTNRSQKMNEVLSALAGRPREVMETLLKSVATERLSEAYSAYIPRVLHETVAKVDGESEKESVKPVLAEGEELVTTTEDTKVVNGDSTNQIENEKLDSKNESIAESAPVIVVESETSKRLKQLAGITD